MYFYRPCVAGAVLHTPLWWIHWLPERVILFLQISYHFPAQTKRALELTFWENFHPTPCITCQVSHVMCQMSHVTRHMSSIMWYLSHFSPTRPSGPSWYSSRDVCLRPSPVLPVPFSCYFFQGLSLALRSHDQFKASDWVFFSWIFSSSFIYLFIFLPESTLATVTAAGRDKKNA